MRPFALFNSPFIKRTGDFERVYAVGRAAQDALVRAVVAPNGLGHARLGLSVGRRYGNAVQRNRFKRLVREAFRLTRPQWPAGFDVIVIPRASVKVVGSAVKPPSPTLAAITASVVKIANAAAAKFPADPATPRKDLRP